MKTTSHKRNTFWVIYAVASCLTACGSSAPDKEVVIPPTLQSTYDNFQYAPAVRAGNHIYLSGVVVTLKDGETASDITPAVKRAFDEIETTLKAAGADLSDIVDVTSYLTDLDAQLGPLWTVKGERIKAPYPAWTAIGVDRLYGGDAALIEIKVTAYKSK